MSWVVQDLADAFFALARAAPGSPSLAVYDGEVPDGAEPAYALVYFYIETRDGLSVPDAVPLSFDSDVIDAWAYVHNVSRDPEMQRGARAVAGRFRSAVLNQTLTVSGRQCFPIRWSQGQPPVRDELTGIKVADLVDVYSFRSVPG